jgi:DNA polymerase III subunit epsilon
MGYEEMAKLLDADPDYRVLRRLSRFEPLTAPADAIRRRGLLVDVETTGLDAARDEIIELAMVGFDYTIDGLILSVDAPFQSLREPGRPIPPEVTTLTGLDAAAVAGHRIDTDEVTKIAAGADLIIAHNAAFDRRFLERFATGFDAKAWACSMTQVDWAGEGFEGLKLAHLAADAGFFYDRHRAANDCLAAIELLRRPLPRSGAYAMTQLLEKARTPACRIWAERAPFDLKDMLKARGYRWNADGAGGPRAWYIDVPEKDVAAEVDYLQREIYLGEIDPLIRRIDALVRFSDRL